jgi:hypothetical protein
MNHAWGTHLKADPIPWLLEPENPSVRYWALINLLDRPTDDAQVLKARAAIAQQPLVGEIFARQHPDGHWGGDETKPYTAQGAVGTLSVLHMLGTEPDERAVAGCDSFLYFSQHECGGFSLRKTQRSGIFPCTTGEHLPMLVYFGLGDDPRVRRAFGFVIEDMARPDALDCGRYQHQDCLWGAIATLNGLAVLPANMRSPDSEHVVRRLADALLDADYEFEGEHKRWLTFGVPRMWDLLSALRALAQHGYARDPRFTPLLDLVLAGQDEEGRWLCGSVSRTWPVERRNRPSKWVTLDALRLLKATAKENKQSVRGKLS